MPRLDDDDIDVIEGLSVEQDDERYRSKSGVGERSRGERSSRITAANSGKSGKKRQLLLLLLLLVIGSACGWLVLQTLKLQSQLSETQVSLELARKRIDQLGTEVFTTGADFTQTGNVIDEKFKFFDSEIRKLWDVSNKRNRTAIAKISAQINTLTTNVKAASTQAKSGEQQLKSITAKHSELSAGFKQLSNQLLAENTTLRATVENQSEQILVLRSEMELMQRRLKNIPDNLVQRVINNEEAVEAIDATRRQLIGRITQLQDRMNQMQGGSSN